MSGLFQRALELRQHSRPGQGAEDEFALDEKSGISTADRQDILAEIDKVADESRISITPETLAIKAVKKGFVFPLLVNLLSVALLAAGGFTLYTIFQKGETVLMEEANAVASAEGKLIAELKKESEAKLLEKNREITRIQSQLEDIDRQRQDLQVNMEVKIQARAAELERRVEAELAAERERLRGQGLSEADITRRLQELEAEKTSAFQAELESFKRQAEAERRQSEQRLQRLQSEFEQGLAQANAERQRVQEDARQREAELRRQLDSQARQLEKETLEARQELNRLAAQQEKEQLAAGQLNGLYSRVKSDIQKGSFDQALAGLDSIRRFLDDPAVATLPNMLQGREIELFVVDSISSLVKGEMQKKEVDTGSLIAAAEQLSGLKNRVNEGDALFKRGEIAAAEARYREALSLIAEINKAHLYFLNKADQAELVRRQNLREFLARAEAASARGDQAAALDSYTKALAYLPEDAATVEKMVSQVRRAGFELGSAQQRRQDSAAAAEPLARADQLRQRQDYGGAILGYLDLIARYPNSAQVKNAVEGISSSAAALEKQAETRAVSGGGEAARTAGSQELAALQKTLEEKNREIASLRARLEAQGGDAGALAAGLEEKNRQIEALRADMDRLKVEAAQNRQSLEERAGTLQKELQAKVALSETLQQEKKALEREMASLKGQIEQMRVDQTAALANLDEELKKRISRLENVERRYLRLVESYREYAAREDELLSGRGEEALVQSKLYLNAFLASSQDSFPGLWERVKRYDEAFEKAGRAGATEDISEILFELSLRSRPESRELYLQSEKARYRDVPKMLDLIDDLRLLVRK